MTSIPPLTPYLVVSDAAAAIDFYKRAFAATLDGEIHCMPGTHKVMHARLIVNGAMIMLSDDFSDKMHCKSETPLSLGGTPVTFALQFEDVQPSWDQAVAAGATVTMPLADQFWGDRYGQVVDPFGHKWSLSQPLKNMDPEQINQSVADHFEKEKATQQ